MFKSRRDYLKKAVCKKGLGAVLLDSPSNLYYYTGFTGGEAVFFMTADSGQDSGYIITDSRYYEQVEKECPGLDLVRLEKRDYGTTVKELLESLGLLEEMPGDSGNAVDTKAGQNGGDNLGSQKERNEKVGIAIEASMSLSRYLKLCKTCGETLFQVEDELIQESRMVKDEEELAKIAKAEAIGDAAFSYILDVIKPGITEAEVALELEFFMKRQGASKLSFDTIVASGSNSSMPHAQVTDRKLQKGDFVTMDFGCVYQGYCSDMTRTVALGTPTEEMRKVYQIVLDANRRAMEGIRAGVECKEIDALARDYIAEQGYGEYFGHGLGHSVGLEIHEEPRFSPKCKVMTKENMVITDEPGIYLPGQFGVRIEDLVVVKQDGYECLSHSPRELIVL